MVFVKQEGTTNHGRRLKTSINTPVSWSTQIPRTGLWIPDICVGSCLFVLSMCSNFLPHPKDLDVVMLIGHRKLPPVYRWKVEYEGSQRECWRIIKWDQCEMGSWWRCRNNGLMCMFQWHIFLWSAGCAYIISLTCSNTVPLNICSIEVNELHFGGSVLDGPFIINRRWHISRQLFLACSFVYSFFTAFLNLFFSLILLDLFYVLSFSFSWTHVLWVAAISVCKNNSFHKTVSAGFVLR